MRTTEMCAGNHGLLGQERNTVEFSEEVPHINRSAPNLKKKTDHKGCKLRSASTSEVGKKCT